MVLRPPLAPPDPEPDGLRDGAGADGTDASDADVSAELVVSLGLTVSAVSPTSASGLALARPPPEVEGVGKSCCC